MASWRFSVGNLVSRAVAAPAEVSPALADSLLPLANLGSGYPDQEGGLQWRSDGTYAIDFDLNLLASSSDRADAPSGWLDLLNLLSGTPGLPANPPDWGAYGGRATALRLYRPQVQEIDVMPGETLSLDVGIYRPSGAAGASGVQVRVIDRSTGKGWDTTYGTWLEDGLVAVQLATDTWEDGAYQIDPDPARTQRTTYLVILEPIAATYDATSYVYASANGAAGVPVLYAAVDTVALIGHDLPEDTTIALAPQPAGTSITLTPQQPSCYAVALVPQLVRTWRLAFLLPAGVQPRPRMGEVWIGSVRTLLAGAPAMPVGGEESLPGTLTILTADTRREVIPSDKTHTSAELALQFQLGGDTEWRQLRDEVSRMTRAGADPLLLLPGEDWDGTGRVYHGRVEDRLAWQVITRTSEGSLRSVALPFHESPFPSR
jgi:hypothetical protein